MLQDTSTDQILELSELAQFKQEQETVDQWIFEEGPMSEAKAMSDRYRPNRGPQTKKEFWSCV